MRKRPPFAQRRDTLPNFAESTMTSMHVHSPTSANSTMPVRSIGSDHGAEIPKDGIGLCLSGGGYRAMLFHTGTLWRLNELGILRKLNRVSSVSGGSIVAGVLGHQWMNLTWNETTDAAENFVELVVARVRALARKTIDRGAIIGGSLLPGSISSRVVRQYRKRLFGEDTLQALPEDGDGPRFVINALNVQSGALWRFMRPYMRDWRVGEVKNPEVQLAAAVAASSSFPPFLSPLELELDDALFTPNSGSDLQDAAFRKSVVLTDGGVYDNLGLETVWKRYKTVLVSDAGGKLAAAREPKRDWLRHTYRVLNLIDDQVRSLRKRQVIDSLAAGERLGAYWGIRTDIANYGLENSHPAPLENTLALARTPTRLKKLSKRRQERLINWGYAVCDAAMRTHVTPEADRQPVWPYDENKP